MIVRYILAALAAGMIAGLLQTAVMQARVNPLILEAEKYETAPTAHHDHAASLDFGFVSAAQAHVAGTEEASSEEEGGMLFGPNRLINTLVASLVTGAGYALVLMAASLLIGRNIALSEAALWAACGWLTFQFLPAVGLPPELPGFPAAELGARQIWWVGTAVASAVALYLLILRKESWAKLAGIVLILAPHVIGAPQPDDIKAAVPAVLAAEYAVAALASGLIFWLMIGYLLAIFTRRIEPAQ